jgi:hypothetical protein
MPAYRSLVLQRHRHLKWKAFDRLEALLMSIIRAGQHQLQSRKHRPYQRSGR